MNYTDILYSAEDGVVTITINRPKSYNAFTAIPVKAVVPLAGKAAVRANPGESS